MSEKTTKDGQFDRPFFVDLIDRHRRRVFRLSALFLVILPFLVVELFLRMAAPAWVHPNTDPFIGFSSNSSLFELDPKNAKYLIKKEHLRSFVQNSFSAIKDKNTYRIFCLGGSTVQGRPYSIETAFTTWLKLALKTAHPGKNFEIVNVGGVSYASYRLLPILQECLNKYQPDLILLCTGNNEFLEDRSYGNIKKAAPLVNPILKGMKHLKLVQLAIQLGHRNGASKTQTSTLGPQVNAILDYERGIQRYHRNEKWKLSVERHFENNIGRMMQLCKDKGVAMMLLSPCFNLKDTPPFKSEHASGLSEADKNKWQIEIQSASESMGHNLDQAIKHLKSAIAIDQTYAATWYSLGQAYLQKGQFQRARQSFQQALELDICPLRINTNLRSTLRQATEKWTVPYLDLQELAKEQSPYGIPGNEFLIDHVHPTIRGHQIIGLELAKSILNDNFLPDQGEDWISQIDSVFASHLNSIPDVYYLVGMERLKGLKAWTQGRADGKPIENHPKVPNGIEW